MAYSASFLALSLPEKLSQSTLCSCGAEWKFSEHFCRRLDLLLMWFCSRFWCNGSKETFTEVQVLDWMSCVWSDFEDGNNQISAQRWNNFSRNFFGAVSCHFLFFYVCVGVKMARTHLSTFRSQFPPLNFQFSTFTSQPRPFLNYHFSTHSSHHNLVVKKKRGSRSAAKKANEGEGKKISALQVALQGRKFDACSVCVAHFESDELLSARSRKLITISSTHYYVITTSSQLLTYQQAFKYICYQIHNLQCSRDRTIFKSHDESCNTVCIC